MGFRALRVINEDRVQPGKGFPPHSHRDMEIVTCVLEGALEHKDSLGTTSVIRPGELQRMTAGTGVTHSEYNASRDTPVHLLQIWILPERRSLPPSYEQKTFSEASRRGKLALLASAGGADGSVTIHQDARVYASLLDPGQTVRHTLDRGRGAWLQLVEGAATVNGTALATGDGAAIQNEGTLEIHAGEPTELLLFDLA
jgi:redox-sensitive bicupin YhaK (pirin superfamily)